MKQSKKDRIVAFRKLADTLVEFPPDGWEKEEVESVVTALRETADDLEGKPSRE